MKVLVFIDGEIFTNWKTVDITKSIDSISGRFNISAVYDYGDPNTPESPFEAGDEVVIFASKDNGKIPIFSPLPSLIEGVAEGIFTDTEDSLKVMTGFIDIVDTKIGEGGLNISISGRDKTCDLADCTFISKTNEQSEISAFENISSYASQFGITTINKSDRAKKNIDIRNPKLDDKIADIITDIAKENGFLVITDEESNLLLEETNNGVINSSIVIGKNILSGNYKSDYSKRYSEVRVSASSDKSQIMVDNPDEVKLNGASSSFLSPPVKDISAKRYRPITISTKGKPNVQDLQEEAVWRMRLSINSSFSLNVKVQGWLTTDEFGNYKAELWRINRNVWTDARKINLPAKNMLIKTVNFSSSDQGTYTNIELIHPDAYDEFDLTGDSKEEDKTGKGYSALMV